MTKATLIFNARLLDESMDTPGALLIVDQDIRAVFQGYFTSQETASVLAHSVLAEDGRDQDCKLELYETILANVLIANVLAKPGTPSKRMCPFDNKPMSKRSVMCF